MRFKTTFLLLVASFLFGASSFTTADPPMMYIYHFVGYDSSTTVLQDNLEKVNASSSLQLGEGSRSLENAITMQMIEPKVISAMVTSAVAKYKQMKIAGESIQSRMSEEDVMQMVKSYAYPQETDYIMLGEINVIGGGMRRTGNPLEPLYGAGIQYEIDLKVIDVSTQDIISSKSITIQLSQLNSIREAINTAIDDLMVDILNPFLSNIVIYADSTSLDKVLWNTLVLRPVQTMVGGKIVNTSDKDLELAVTTSFKEMGISPPLDAHDDTVRSDHYMLISTPYDRKLRSNFLQGDYYFKVYLKDYKEAEYYESRITVEALRGTAFPIKLLPPPPPPPPPPAFGDLQINNIQNNIGYEVYHVESEASSDRIVSGNSVMNRISHTIYTDNSGNISDKNKSVYYEDLPLGKYIVNAYGRAEESFPGKHFVRVFAFTDTVEIKKARQKVSVTLPDIQAMAGRGIVIYFDPFPTTADEEYRLYIDDSNIPFTIVSVVGELHIEGISEDFSGSLKVIRDGFIPAVINITAGHDKSYLLASLTEPVTEVKAEKKEKIGLVSFLK